jgi:hypothetical protein
MGLELRYVLAINMFFCVISIPDLVGLNNHRQFVLFVATLVGGVIVFDYLTYACTCHQTQSIVLHCVDCMPVFSTVPLSTNQDISSSCPLSKELCALTAHDAFLVSVAAWVTLQLSWTLLLLASQFWQIARQMTTLEVSNLGRYGFMGGRGGASLSGQMGHRHQHSYSHSHSHPHPHPPPGVESEESTLVDGAPPVHSRRHESRGVCAGCGSGFLMNLLGLDRFTKGKAVDGLARAGRATNPFDLGVVANCKDFWTAGRELGVEYDRLYDVPGEGFAEAKRRREADEDEDHGVGGGRKGIKKTIFMGLGLGRRNGYEPVAQV